MDAELKKYKTSVKMLSLTAFLRHLNMRTGEVQEENRGKRKKGRKARKTR